VPEAASPTVRRRRLAAELRRLREDSGLTGEHVAERMHWSASKVSRIENAHTAPRVSEVKKLLQLYGAGGAYAEELVGLAQEAARKGWWETYGDVLPDTYAAYIGLEAGATSSSQWAPELVSGLLQTEDYAREVIRTHMRSTQAIPPGEIEQRVQARLSRQQILQRDPPFRLSVVLCQSVLLRRFGNESVMKSQLNHLITASQYPNVTLRVLPLDAPHPIGTGAFVFLQFSEVHDVDYHDIVYLEHLTGGMYLEEERDTYQYEIAFDNLSKFSLGPAETRDMITAAVQRGFG
jgi:transcriptional regulator with XRE-family HTH domain